MQAKSKWLAAALALAAASAVYAEDKPPQVLRASFAPEATQKYLVGIGLNVPLIEEFGRIERAPFLGKGSLDYSKPVGVMGYVVVPDPQERWLDRTIEENGALVLPVNKGFASIDNLVDAFKDSAAAPQVNGDTVTSRQGNFKRTESNLIYSRGKSTAQIGDNPFAADYKAGTLASATIDVAALRKSGPKLYDALFKIITREFGSPDKLEGAVTEAVFKFARGKIDAIDTASLVLSGDDKGARGVITLAPMNVKPTLAAFPRPTFPTPPAIEMHIAYPDAKSSNWVVDIINSIDFAPFAGLDGGPDGDGPNAKQFARIKENIVRGAKLFTAAEATTIGFTLAGKEPLLLVVNQYTREVDAAKELAEIADSVNAIAKELKMTKIMEVSTAPGAIGKGQAAAVLGVAPELAGAKLTRVLFLDNEKPALYLDVAQSGKTIAVTFSEQKQDGLAAKLIASPTKGKLDSFMTFTFNLKQLVELGLASHSIPRRDGELLRDSVGDIALTATAKSDDAGKNMIIETNIPAATAKDIGGILDKLVNPPARRPAGELNSAPEIEMRIRRLQQAEDAAKAKAIEEAPR